MFRTSGNVLARKNVYRNEKKGIRSLKKTVFNGYNTIVQSKRVTTYVKRNEYILYNIHTNNIRLKTLMLLSVIYFVYCLKL